MILSDVRTDFCLSNFETFDFTVFMYNFLDFSNQSLNKTELNYYNSCVPVTSVQKHRPLSQTSYLPASKQAEEVARHLLLQVTFTTMSG